MQGDWIWLDSSGEPIGVYTIPSTACRTVECVGTLVSVGPMKPDSQYEQRHPIYCGTAHDWTKGLAA